MLFFGTLGMLVLAFGIIAFVILHNRKVSKYNAQLKQLEEEKQQILLNASIRFQEEERNRIAADLHDDAGPLLATARLYLNENLVNQEKAQQLQSIYSAKQIIDDAILLIRNISHSLMPPTLKNFGLESAVNDLFSKISRDIFVAGVGAIPEHRRFVIISITQLPVPTRPGCIIIRNCGPCATLITAIVEVFPGGAIGKVRNGAGGSRRAPRPDRRRPRRGPRPPLREQRAPGSGHVPDGRRRTSAHRDDRGRHSARLPRGRIELHRFPRGAFHRSVAPRRHRQAVRSLARGRRWRRRGPAR